MGLFLCVTCAPAYFRGDARKLNKQNFSDLISARRSLDIFPALNAYRGMKQSVARIGKIKMKSGGASVSVLHQKPRSHVHDKLITCATELADILDDIESYVIVGWQKSGHYSMGYHIDKSSLVGPTMAPSFVADIIRRELLAPIIIDENIYEE